jgi:predicted SprT family Zn-dependent metalloprotease
MMPDPGWSLHFAALGVRLRLNRNRRTLVSLRDQRHGAPVLSVHRALLDDALAMVDIERFARQRGRGDYPELHRAMQLISSSQQEAAVDQTLLRDLPCIGKDFDFQACFERIHAGYFAQLPPPRLAWSRRPPLRTLRSLRFGCYVARSPATVRLNPRLDQPWVAEVFVEHVIHHELIHHLQACDRRRGERQHSPRFRAIERSFPGYARALAWEAANLKRLLAAPQAIPTPSPAQPLAAAG